jgi:hypothetical protein
MTARSVGGALSGIAAPLGKMAARDFQMSRICRIIQLIQAVGRDAYV